MKQGCPISGFLFILALHEVITTTASDIPLFITRQLDNLQFPSVLAYADDLLILAEEEDSLLMLIDALTENLSSVGLSLNISKSSVLIRDPLGVPDDDNAPTTMRIGNSVLSVVHQLVLLGSTIIDTLSRPDTVRNRINLGYKPVHSLLPFLREHRLPWDLLATLYTTIISPTVLCGMKVAALTKANRISLHNFERTAVTLLLSVCDKLPNNKSSS